MGKLKESIISFNNDFPKAYHTFCSGLGSEKRCQGEAERYPNPSRWRQEHHGRDSLHRWIHSVTMSRLGGSPVTEIFASRYFVSRVRVWLQTFNRWTCRYFRCVMKWKKMLSLRITFYYFSNILQSWNLHWIKKNKDFPHFSLFQRTLVFFNDVFWKRIWIFFYFYSPDMLWDIF